MLNYFRYTDEKRLATEMANQLSKYLPASGVASRSKLFSVNKITQLLERTYQIALDHQRMKRLGFIKRAILANAFKWELKAHGYPNDFIEIATEGLIITVSKKIESSSGQPGPRL